jgi:hypothetical protein
VAILSDAERLKKLQESAIPTPVNFWQKYLRVKTVHRSACDKSFDPELTTAGLSRVGLMLVDVYRRELFNL